MDDTMPTSFSEFELEQSRMVGVRRPTRTMSRTETQRRTYGRRGSTGVVGRGFRKNALVANNNNNNSEQYLDGNEHFADETAFQCSSSDLSDKMPQRPKKVGHHMRSYSTTTAAPPPPIPKPQGFADRSQSTPCSRPKSRRTKSNFSFFDETENLEPNVKSICFSPGLADRKRHKRVKSEKELNSPTTTGTIITGTTSFSSLAHYGDNSAWANRPIPTTTPARRAISCDFGYYNDAMMTSPGAASEASSSRKRGVCDSPLDICDDWSTASGFSTSLPSSFSNRVATRTPVRSSPSPWSNNTTDSSATKTKNSNTRARDDRHVAASGHKSDTDTCDDDEDSGDDTSVESTSGKVFSFNFGNLSLSSPAGENLIDTVDETKVNEHTRAKICESKDDVIATMTSYHDVKFLIKVLRKEKSGKLYHGSFALTHSWNVVPPVAWPSSRRVDFLKWATDSLGFTLRAGGAGNAYLQIPKGKGTNMLDILETALPLAKAKDIESQPTLATPCQNVGAGLSPFHIPSSIGGDRATNFGSGYKSKSFEKSNQDTNTIDNDLDSNLLDAMQSLGVEDKLPPPTISTITIDTGHTSNDDNDGNIETAKYCAPRHSSEHYPSAGDLMLHMHGMSPANINCLRTPKVSIQGFETIMNSVDTTNKRAMASPFVGGPNVALTPCFMQTPMMKPFEGWGCNPVQGRDWGCSVACTESVINELFDRFHKAHTTAGFKDSPVLLPLHIQSEKKASGLGLDLDFAASCDFGQSACTPLNECAVVEVTNFGGGLSPDFSASPTYEDRDDTFNDLGDFETRNMRRKKISFAKHKRMSLWASMKPSRSSFSTRKSLFVASASLSTEHVVPEPLCFDPCFPVKSEGDENGTEIADPIQEIVDDSTYLEIIFGFLDQFSLLCITSLVSSKWSDCSTSALATNMLRSVNCLDNDDIEADDIKNKVNYVPMDKSWKYLVSNFPWACFLSDGAFKRVYKVYNNKLDVEEALSVMDVDVIESTGNASVVGTELAVSVMMTSLVRRAICPNFVATRGFFSCPFEPPSSHWGSAIDKQPKGDRYVKPKNQKKGPKQPSAKCKGNYQYIRMELCDKGDAEEFLKRQTDEMLPPDQARFVLFQIAFALYAAADRFSMKHYDIKLLNVFLKSINSSTILRYGLGTHTFAFQTSILAKLADFGTADVEADSCGQPVTIAQFTTLENTPPEFLVLGDKATQGHGHDCFGLGLCMLHLYTGHAPYEEILEDITCPVNLKRRLRSIWECDGAPDYSVLRSVILSDVDQDTDGNILEGEPDDTLYDTIYRYLVLFGIPDNKYQGNPVWGAIIETLEGTTSTNKNSKGKKNNGNGKKKVSNDVARFTRDRKRYSLSHGSNDYIARARSNLEKMEGGLKLLYSLVSFDPMTRANTLDVINSPFMAPLRETTSVTSYRENDYVRSYTAFSTKTN